MPEKACPDCGQKQHVRVRECVCGFVFPRKEKKVKKDVDPHDVDYVFNGWKRVPARTRLAKCGTCSKKMKGGMVAWHSSFTDGDKYWWCESCLKDFKDETFYRLTESDG
jgi:hypothetical protein|tara:strand:- start:673 stop:999 length:327 start_codon:yes stop_codon:yes gene_type:complete